MVCEFVHVHYVGSYKAVNGIAMQVIGDFQYQRVPELFGFRHHKGLLNYTPMKPFAEERNDLARPFAYG